MARVYYGPDVNRIAHCSFCNDFLRGGVVSATHNPQPGGPGAIIISSNKVSKARNHMVLLNKTVKIHNVL